MWHCTSTSVLRCSYAVGSSAAKSVWRHPVSCHQLQTCNFGVAKPSFRNVSGYILSLGPSSSSFICRSAGLLKLYSICARQSGSVRFLQLHRCTLTKQLRHASSTKTISPAVSQQVSKKALPKASEVYRLLSLAKPEKWKLFGKNVLSILL